MAYGSLKGFDEILDGEEEVPIVKPAKKKELIEYKRLTTANKVQRSSVILCGRNRVQHSGTSKDDRTSKRGYV